jgi:hypothetical protein
MDNRADKTHSVEGQTDEAQGPGLKRSVRGSWLDHILSIYKKPLPCRTSRCIAKWLSGRHPRHPRVVMSHSSRVYSKALLQATELHEWFP